MRFQSFSLFLAIACLAIAVSSTFADDSADVKMSVVASGAMPKVGGYRPHQVKMSPDKPAELKMAPDLAAPIYGSVTFGDKSYIVVLDEPDGKDATLYVDANGNGDLTDDPATKWDKRSYAGPAGARSDAGAARVQLTQYSGGFKLPLPDGGDKPTLVSFGAYRFDKNDPQRVPLKSTFLYYADYALEGDITLGGAKYHAMLVDHGASGDFRGTPGVMLMIDVNGDGKFASQGEAFDAAKPFNIKGTTWALADRTAAGSFKVAKSAIAVAEILPPPDHGVGRKITAFKATKMDGKPVDFPADYKGKLVMLDFWATWCGPCMVEVPSLVKAYNEYHPKGVELLGISLDQENAAEKIKSVTADKGMTWAQVYDGKFWKAAVADKYGINAIPAAFLVDGDTGEILADEPALRGERLAQTLRAALEKKAAKEKIPGAAAAAGVGEAR